MAALLEVYYYFSYSELLRYVDNPEVIAVNCNPEHSEGEVKQSIEIATAPFVGLRAPRNDYFLWTFATDTCQAASVLHKTVIADTLMYMT